MQSVEQQQRLHLLVARQLPGQLPPPRGGSHHRHDARQPDPVYVENGFDQFAGGLPRDRVRGMAERRDKLVDTAQRLLDPEQVFARPRRLYRPTPNIGE
jgi:hypothetical protein